MQDRCRRTAGCQGYPAVAAACLKIRINRYCLQKFRQIHAVFFQVLYPAFQHSEGHELADQFIEPFRLLFDAVKGLAGIFTRPLPGQLQGHIEPGQRRA